ncbi:hypothetical protein KFS98_003597 [Salmonella enterica]|nr:hypothetical protein [Salmonella enterica]
MKELALALEVAMSTPAADRPMGGASKKSKVTSLYVALSLKVMENGLTFDEVISKELQQQVIEYLAYAQKEHEEALQRVKNRDAQMLKDGLDPLTGLEIKR